LLDHLLAHEIFGGYDLGQDYPELENCLLLAVTEKISREDIDYLVDVLQEVHHD
jgi:glycine dehydrogenase subunit 1